MSRAPALSRPRVWLACVLLAAALFSGGAADRAAAQAVAWEQWQHQVGVVDLGVRADGSLVSMAAGHLFSVSGSGAITPLANGPDGFSADPNAEPYFVVAQPLAIDDAGCNWTADDLLILDLTSPPGIARVDSAGRASRLVTLNGVDTLGGIALDTTGSFGHRLLVTGTHAGAQTTLFAVDCQGGSRVLLDSGPPVEGGLAVAPPTFGRFAGDLIASDENSGQVWAFDPNGQATLVVTSGLPSGGDTGVESEGFVPPGFLTAAGSSAGGSSAGGSSAGGFAYLADRGTADNPFPGNDTILRLSASALAASGVQEGDLLIATEGGGTTIAVRCAQTCTVLPAAQGSPGGHIEGHLVLH